MREFSAWCPSLKETSSDAIDVDAATAEAAAMEWAYERDEDDIGPLAHRKALDVIVLDSDGAETQWRVSGKVELTYVAAEVGS